LSDGDGGYRKGGDASNVEEEHVMLVPGVVESDEMEVTSARGGEDIAADVVDRVVAAPTVDQVG
jgi:hypothetical protein